MADPLKVLRSLEQLSDQYSVFEPDQVLTHQQLNSLASYLDDQDRLTRVDLLGVGVVSGLRVGVHDGDVRVSRGFGVTTDGDLLRLPSDTLYDRFRPYDAAAPAYAPFYRGAAGDSAMLELHELVPAGERDALAKPLSRLPGRSLAGKVVLMLMESVVNDPDLCTGTDCDNLGRDALHRVRLLLIDAADASELVKRAPRLEPASERAQRLPELNADRPALGRDITTTGVLATRYRAATKATLTRLVSALELLAETFPDVLDELFGSDPSGEWRAMLKQHAAAPDGAGAALQSRYGLAKDLVETYNATRDAFLNDDSVPLPDVAAFPKHLLLGQLDAPSLHRTGLYPAPLDGAAREQAARARFGVRKLHLLLHAFQPPTDTELRVTPSRGEHAALDERAIPWHYRMREELPVHAGWSYRLAARTQGEHNLGYRAREWHGSERALAPLQFAVAGNDFFRVEGHLGRPVEEVLKELQGQIAAHNLPFVVQAVLMHNDKRHIRVKPGIRYTDLHRLHYLVRHDVASRLEESKAFGERYLGDVTKAVADRQIVGSSDSGESAIGIARAARDAVSAIEKDAAPALASAKYSDYRANTSWKQGIASTLESVGGARVSLGHVSRNDFTSAFDSLITTNQPHWLDWLDDLIVAGDARADERLLFGAFVVRHPGLDHLGGVWRGGTLVLTYDDGGRVVADFTVPYPCAEVDDDEPAEPPLKRPPYRTPAIIEKPVRVLRPIDLKIDDRFIGVRADFQKDLLVHNAGIEGLLKGVQFQAPTTPPLKGLSTGDVLLDEIVRDVDFKRLQIDNLRAIADQPGVTPEVRGQADARLKKTQDELALAISDAADRVVATNVDVHTSGAAEATKVLTSGVDAIRDTPAKATLVSNLDRIEGVAGVGLKPFLVQLRTFGAGAVRAPSRAAPAKRAPAKRAPAKRAPAKRAPAKRAPARRAPPTARAKAGKKRGGR